MDWKWLGMASAALLVSGCCWGGHQTGSTRGYAVVVPIPGEAPVAAVDPAEGRRLGRLRTTGGLETAEVSQIDLDQRSGRVAAWVSSWSSFVQSIGGDTLYYDFDTAALGADAVGRLTRMVAFLRDNPEARVVVDGHTDAVGTREYNLGLGERRSHAVRDFMVVRGIQPSRVRTRSYGEEAPAVRGDSERDRALNRRAVVSARQ